MLITTGLSGVAPVCSLAQPRPSRSPRPHCSRPRVSVGQSVEQWPFACHSRGSHGTRASSANRHCVHKPHGLQWRPLAPRHAQPYHKSWPRPRPPRCQVRREQEFTCEVHGPAAIRGLRCWHLRPRKHSYPSASCLFAT